MALIDKASLLMVPSVYEDGTLYNVLPSGNKAPDETGNHNGYDQTRADFTFSRGSNLAATRVNANGLIEKGRENLLLQSNQLDTTWLIGGGGSGLTLTGGQADKDGGNTAWLIDEVTNDQAIYQVVSTNGVQTFSIYAKAGTNEWMRLGLGGGAFSHAYFDLVNGVLGNTLNVVDSSIEDAGNGWWRCSVTANKSVNAVYVYPSEANNSAGTNGSIYIQDAQLEVGLVATDYIETGATTATAGVLENTPRIDYSSGAGALLLESQRTNKTEHAEYFEGWSRVNTGVAILDANAYTSPEGLQNAYKVTLTEGGGQSQIYKVLSGFTIGTKYTQSLYVKYISGSGENFQIVKSFGTAGVRCTFTNGGADLSVIAVGGTQANDFGKEPLGNGWFRIWFTYASNTTNWEINISRNSGTGSDVYAIYGHQIEEGSHVSSYVPTYGSAATRGADSCSVTGASDVIGQTEGTLFFEVDLSDIETAGGYSGILLSDGTSSNQIYITYYSTGRVQTASLVSGSVVVNISDSNYGLSAGRHKFAVAYKANDYAFYIDGSLVGTNTSAAVPATSKVDLFFNSSGSLNHKEVTLFNERLSNTELATLTTL